MSKMSVCCLKSYNGTFQSAVIWKACDTSSTKMAANISSYPSAFMLVLSKGGGIYFFFSNALIL